jgi:tRNA threonylcarbamoyladenosine biosynthesis protein TsaB
MLNKRILAIDTSTAYFTLGIYDRGKVYEYNLEVGRRLSGLLHPTLSRALEAVALKLSDIDYFACGLGPGSFTGLRIGLACIKGICWATEKPLIGISSLEVLAQNLKATCQQIVVLVDAKRDLVYASVFRQKNSRLIKMRPEALLDEKGLMKIVKPGSVILGDASSLYRERLIQKVPGLSFLDKDYWYPRAHNLIALALGRIKQKKLDNLFKIKPIYLYPPDCQVRSSKTSACHLKN